MISFKRFTEEHEAHENKRGKEPRFPEVRVLHVLRDEIES